MSVYLLDPLHMDRSANVTCASCNSSGSMSEFFKPHPTIHRFTVFDDMVVLLVSVRLHKLIVDTRFGDRTTAGLARRIMAISFR
jgi:hypothetical protein